MSVRQQLIQVVQELLGRHKLDAKTMQYWEQYITNGSSTVDDFRKSIYENAVYRDVVRGRFESVVQTLGLELSKTDIETLFSDFISEFGWENAKVENSQVFLAKTTAFVSKYTKVINDMIIYELGSADYSTLDVVQFYLNRFATVPGYNVSGLAAEISSKAHVVVPPPSPSDFDFSLSQEQPYKPKYNKEELELFEEVFQRAMYVQEYFKYIEQGQGQDWRAILAKHSENFNRLREIFETYTGKTISEYFFVHKFLEQVDTLSFFDNIVDSIVASQDYKTNMQKILAEKYMAMFDQTLEESDITYVFEIVKKQKLDIVNEKLTSILTNLKEETDEIVSHIFKQFLKTLDRSPDMYDMEQYIKYYRERLNEGFGVLDSKLESILMHTLEFHDIIKKKIKVLYSTKNGKEVLPSQMFDILNRLIIKIDDLNMTNIDSRIIELA